MKQLILVGLMLIPIAGCASHQGGGEEYYYTSTGGAESRPEPAASPSFRPGMNPSDPCDPHFVEPSITPAPPPDPAGSTTF